MTNPATTAAQIIQKQLPDFTPKVGIILGSGLGPLAESLDQAVKISYDNLPGFPECSVAGHHGQIHLGYLRGVPVACLEGRAHFYEGYSHTFDKIPTKNLMAPTRTLKLLGCDTLLATNSSGSLRKEVTPGNLVVINDHINYQFRNPLVGPNEEEFGPRFVGMEDAYDVELRAMIHKAGGKLNIPLTEGVYIGVLGPCFETPAEIRAFRMWGADVVGMSTIPDVITARHCGMKVAVIATITNMAAGMHDELLSHDVTLRGAQEGVVKLTALVTEFVGQFA